MTIETIEENDQEIEKKLFKNRMDMQLELMNRHGISTDPEAEKWVNLYSEKFSKIVNEKPDLIKDYDASDKLMVEKILAEIESLLY